MDRIVLSATRIRTVLAFCTVLGFQGVVAAADPATPAKPVPENLQQLEQALVEILKETGLPGLGIAIVSRDAILWTAGLGLADVERQIPATADTLFRIGSTSKAFVALAALQLRAQGKLDFDATLASLAPEVEFHNPWEATHPVRIVHLLEHTTGFDDIHLRDYAYEDPRPDSLLRALAHDPHTRTSRWPPGERFSYCNSGPPIVAYVIEKITGQRFEDYARQHLFEPMGMPTATYFKPDDPAVPITELYQADGVTRHPYWHFALRPAGTLNVSAREMAQYVRFYLNRGRVNGQALVSEADILRLETPASSPAAKAGMSVGYGLYSITSFDDKGFMYRGHGGGVIGGGSGMAYLPEAGIGYAYMFNASNGAAVARVRKLIQSYITRGLPKPELPPALPISPELADQYAGFYVPTNPRSELTALLGRLTGVARLSFAEDAAQFGGLIGGGTKRYVGAGGRLLRREDQPAATLALIEPSGEGVTIAAGSQTLRKTAAPVALGPLALCALAALLGLSAVLFVPVWGLRAALGKIALRPYLALRLWPLAATAALAAFAFGPILMFGDPQMFARYSSITVWSLALFSVSVLALVVPWAGLVAVLRGEDREAHRGLRWHARLVLAATGLFSLYLLAAGAIPFVTWT